GSGRTGRAGARRPPRSPQASAVLMAWAWLVLALFWRRESGKGTPAGRLSGGLRCCVRPMPICIVCAECLPVRNGKPSGASFDCDLLKHGQHKPRPSKGWSVGPLMLVGLPPHKRTDVGAVGIRRSGVLLVVGEVSAIPILGALASSPLPANMEASRAAGDGLHPRPSAPGGTHTGGCLRGVWALGAGRGKAAPPAAPKPRPSSWLGPRVRRGTPVGRLSGGLRCCVRPMPICIVCAECLPVRNGKPSGACFDCDLLKHGQHKPRPSKGWSVGPLMLVGLPPHKRTDAGAVGIRRSGVLLVVGEVSAIPILGALASSPLPANMEASRAAGDGLHPRPSAPGGTHTGRVWSSSSSVARDPEISSTWLAKCRQSRHARLPHGSWGMLLGALASSPSPAKVEASHRQVGPVPRFLLLGSQLVLRPESSCLPGHAWACLLPFACRDARMRRGTAGRQHPPQAASVVGPSALLPWPRSVSCAAYPSRRHSIVPNVPFSPCAAPLGAAARGGPQGARCVPRPAHGRTCPGRWPIASSPDLSDAEHTVGTRPRPLFAPKASVRRFVRTTPATVLGSSHAGGGVGEECYLVDPASSHMLVSKIKPCMCNYSLFDGTCYSDNRSNSRANTCNKPRLLEGMHLLDKRSTRAPPVAAMIHDNSTDRTALVPATHHSNFCPINFRWVRFRRGSLRNGYHIQGRQQARKLPNPDTGRIHWRASLVANAVSNCWFSVLVNGEHAGFFHSTRGLRQGDPLSPALFVLAADYLSQGLNRLFVAHPTMYYQSPGRVRVSHLAYADDMMIFTNICRQHMELLRDFLHAYERVSGQRINSAKSSFILSRQVPLSQLQEVQYVMGYQLKYLPVTYLGVPLYKGNRKACLFDSLISRIRDMLQGWAMTNLSHGGRLALIRSVLQAMPLHLLQVIHPPKSVLITIERIFNGFFWGSYNGRRHIHWCSWDKICRPVAEGGLGIRSLAEYVRAFSMKLWWRFRLKSSLWSEYLHDRYCRALHPTHVPYNRNHSSVWHRLCRIRDVAEPLIFWTLGQGAVSFWHDNWFGEKPLAQLVRGAPDTMEPVCYYWHEGEWNVPKIFRIVPPQIAHIICRIPIAAGQRDRIVWTATSNGTFSTASAWEAIRVASPRRQLFTDIWHRSLRPTVSVFLWRLFQDWIPVDERMKRKGFSFASKCQCCEAEESISHLFVEGEVVREVWLHFANVFGLQLCETGDLVNLVHFWRYSTPFHSDLHIRTLVPFLILWSTWTQRNAAKYHGAHFTATGTILEVQRHLRTLYAARIMTSIQWKGDLHRALAMGFCFRPIAPQAPRVVRWSTPSPAWFKLNSDGSSLGNPGPAAAAGIIRDADGQVRLAYQFALGTATSVVSELTAVWRGLELARAHSLAPIVVEVDATVVLQLLQSRASGIWEVQHLIMRIVQLQQELGSDVRHIFREANGAADHLAKDAASRQLTRVMYQEDITGVLRGIIRLDKMGTPYLRRWTLGWAGRSASGVHRSSRPFCRRCAPGLNWPGRASGAVTLKKLECSKQAYALYTLAWDNIIGFRSYYVGLRDRTFAKDVFINQERKLGARRRSDTVLVSTINDADQGSADVAFRTPPAPYEKSKSLGSGGSMVARLKLKGIDGRAPPGVEPAA
ncbi:UNVERIFIED_CONTAM: putative mitochondrial protein, partial [Sesamum indicum]